MVMCSGMVWTDHDDSVGNVECQPDDSLIDRESNDEHSITEASHAAEHRLQIPPLPTAVFDYLRLVATFVWLTANTARPLQLARCGFYYMGQHRLRCFFCGVELPLQDGHESSAIQRHGALSPHCTLAGPGHHTSDSLLRDIHLWMPLAVKVRRDDITLQDLNINLR